MPVTATQDLLVGTVAVIVGSLLLVGAVANSAHLMQLAKPRLLTQAIGNRSARAVLAVIGGLILAMGVLIASGWRLAW